MRSHKALSVFAALVMACSAAFSEDDSLESVQPDKDDRVGVGEIKKMASISFKSEDYRLDPDFKLGYGDTVTISLWGKLEGSYKLTIDRDGSIFTPMIGKLSILGLSLDEARTVVRRELDKKYSNVEFDMNLADVRDIRVTILGNAQNAGVYMVGPFSRITDALIECGGPNAKGSISDIRLIRDDKQIASFNIYDFIIKGDQSNNMRLQHGDVIFVPPLKGLIVIKGDVANPGKYEIGEKINLGKAIEMTGGILPSELKQKAYIKRVDPQYNTLRLFKEAFLENGKIVKREDDIAVKNGDVIIVINAYDYTPYSEEPYKTVSISGQIPLPGKYLIKDNETLGSLIKRAGGLKENAFIEGAVFTRRSLIEEQKAVRDELINARQKAILEEKAYLTEANLPLQDKEARTRALEHRQRALDITASRRSTGRIKMNLEDIINGKTDLVLMEGDSIQIPTIPEWVVVTGAVYNPESIFFSEGKGLGHYLDAAGLTRFADKDEIRIIKPNGYVKSKSTGYDNIARGDIIIVPEKL